MEGHISATTESAFISEMCKAMKLTVMHSFQ